MKNLKCKEVVCNLCGKGMVLDTIEPYGNVGEEIFYFYCENDNCNGKHEIIDYSKVTDEDLNKMYYSLDNLGWFSGDYESIDEDIKLLEKEIARRKVFQNVNNI